MYFKIEKKLKNNLGRAGVLSTAHGDIHTPCFVPVGTKGTVKSLTPEQVVSLGAEVVLANTYHLYLEPGDELIAEAGGLHKFMNWNKPLVTDSGGFQVFSLGSAFGKQISKIASYATHNFSSLPTAEPNPSLGKIMNGFASSRPVKGEWPEVEGVGNLAKVDENGASFKSHIDGSIHYITPEKSIQIQHNLRADIIFAFDECTSPTENSQYQKEAMERTHRWAERSLEEHKKLGGAVYNFSSLPTAEPNPSLGKIMNSPALPALFGIVQGGRYKDLREESARVIGSMPFDGFGIGGSFVKEDMDKAVKWVNTILPEEKPRHLLGVGEPEDIFSAIENGCDMFDCVTPTRNARNGSLYTKYGKINILNAKYRSDFSPIGKDCECYTCGGERSFLEEEHSDGKGETLRSQGYSRAYLSHLFRGKEMLASTLATIHNLHFIISLVKKIRQSILDDKFFEFKKEFLKSYIRQ